MKHSCKILDMFPIRSYKNLKGPVLGLRQFLTTEILLRSMKNDFYFMLKTLFVLEIFPFLSRPFDYVKKWLDKKAMVNSKIYDITDWTETIHMLCNVSRSTGNQTMKFGQLKKYSIKNVFLPISCKKWGSKTSILPHFVI